MADRKATQRARRVLDERLAATMVPALPKAGWIRAVRTALGMTQSELARRLQITAQSQFQLETNERAGTIRLDSLRRAADALGCDLAYVFIPRAGTLEQAVRDQAARLLDQRQGGVERTMALEDQQAVLTDRAREGLIDQLVAEADLWPAG